MRIRIEFKPQDLWVGLYWKRDYAPRHGASLAVGGEFGTAEYLDVWVCVVPMLPVHLTWDWFKPYK